MDLVLRSQDGSRLAARIRPRVPRQAQSLTPGDLDDGVMPLQELAEMPSAKAPALACVGLVVLCLLVGRGGALQLAADTQLHRSPPPRRS
jgi:hypothetical protein